MSATDCFFSPTNENFLHISSDSRLNIWDVVGSSKKKKAYVDRNHLAHNFTCIAWDSSSAATGLLAVGYSDGIVMIWDINRGVVAQTLGIVNESPTPTDVIFGHDNSNVFVSADGYPIFQYNRHTGEVIQRLKVGKKGASKLALNPKTNVLAACSSSLKLIDIDTGRKKKMETSFSGGVGDAQFSACGRFLFVSSGKSRELIMFDVRAEAALTPALVIPVTYVLKTLDVVQSTESTSIIGVVGCSHDSGAVAYRIEVSKSKSQNGEQNGKHVTSSPSILSKTEISNRGSMIISCRFGELNKILSNGRAKDGYDCSSVLVATGSRSQPIFQSISLVDESSRLFCEKVSIAPIVTELEPLKGSNKSRESDALSGPVILGAHEMGGKKRPQVDNSGDLEHIKRSKLSNTLEASLLDGMGKSSEGAESLEQRLEALSSTMRQMEDYAENRGDSSALQRAAEAAGSALKISESDRTSYSNSEVPTTDSFVTLMDQALQSGDDALLEQCLACNEFQIVEETARRLATNRVVPLLRKLVAKFEKRPSRSALLTHWLSAVLRSHTSYLVTLPDLSFQLAGLSQILEQRLGSYTKLSSLAGRLDLLMSQVSYSIRGNQAEGGSTGGAPVQTQLQDIVPIEIYREEDEDD